MTSGDIGAIEGKELGRTYIIISIQYFKFQSNLPFDVCNKENTSLTSPNRSHKADGICQKEAWWHVSNILAKSFNISPTYHFRTVELDLPA